MRITGGQLRGRVVKVARGGVRPTQERVREAIFSSLGGALVEADVLDLYAGSGALGLEAWSRGAGHVVWVEQDAAVFRQLKTTVATLCGPEAAHCCVRADAFAYLARCSQPFDFILADPPYDRHTSHFEMRRFLESITQGACLKSGGLLVFEQRATSPVGEHAGWVLVKDKKYGDTRVLMYEAVALPDQGP